MSTPSVNRGINIFIESGDAQKAVDKLQAKFNDLKKQISEATDPKIIKGLNAELNKITEPLDRAQKKLSGQLNPSLKELGATVRNLSNELKNLSSSDAGYEKKVLQLRQANLAYKEQQALVAGLNKEHSALVGKVGEGVKEFTAPLIALTAVTGIVEGINSFLEHSKEEFEQAEREAARFQNTLEAAGRSDALDRLNYKIEEFANQFKFLDNDEIKGIFSQLITYGKLTENQITQLIPVIVDLYAKQKLAGDSAASLAGSTELIIKALEGNAKGLKTYGINIKDAGDLTERFGVIMNQLEPKLKDAGKTFGETLPGQVQTSKQAIKDLEEQVGALSGPVVDKFKLVWNSALSGFLTYMYKLKDSFVEFYQLAFDKQAYLDAQTKKTQDLIEKNSSNNANSVVSEAAKTASQTQQRLLAAGKTLKEANETALDGTRKLLKSYNSIYNSALDEFNALNAKGQLMTTNAGFKARENLREVSKILNGLNEQITNFNKTLGTSTADKPNDKPKAKDFSVDDEEAKLLDRIKKALVENSDVFTKKITEINLQLDDLLRGAKKKLDAYLKDENTTLAQRNAAQKEFNKLSVDIDAQRWAEIQKQLEEADKQSDKAIQNRNERQLALQRQLDNARLEAFAKQQQAIAELVAKRAKEELGQYNAQDELNVLKSRGKARLAATIKQLKDQEEIELGAEDAVGAKRALIQAKYDKQIQDARTEYFKNIISTVSDYIEIGITALNKFYSISNAKAQAEIDADTKINDRKKKSYQAQLDAKLITQGEYQKKVDALDKKVADKERELRIKQFRQNQITSIAQASINVAEAVTKAFTAGPISGQILAGITAALGAVEIALIANQKPPTYAKGGLLNGPLHSDGGMPIVNPRTGRKVAEVEGGEPILSRNTYANNRGLVDALLYTSMHRNGASIQPAWKSADIPQLNFPALQRSMTRFALGGIIPGSNQQQNGQPDPVQLAMLEAISNLNDQLARGIKAPISLYDLNRQQARLNRIISDASA